MKTTVVVHALNDSTVAGFVDDQTPFEKCSQECFDALDLNADGVLSKEELRSGFWKLLPGIGYVSQPKEELNGLHDEIFERFEADRKGVVDQGEFKELLREIMLEVACRIGGSPVLVALEHGSLLMRAAQHEQSKMA